MKQKDILLIVVIVIISGAFSYFLSHLLFSSPKNRSMKAEHVSAIVTDFTPPDQTYFNANAIDPTQLVIIGAGSNSTPFTGGH
jgi:hypothetical protein